MQENVHIRCGTRFPHRRGAHRFNEELGFSGTAKVKKAIDSLGIEPSAKKGIRCLYDAAAVKKIQYALK